MGPLLQDSPDPKPQFQAWGCGSALEELRRREAGPERAAVGTWAVVSHLDMGPGVGDKSTLASGPCVPETKHRATACSVCGSGRCAGSGCGWAGRRNRAAKKHTRVFMFFFTAGPLVP